VECDIIHYAGHAYFDRNNPEDSAWLLSDDFLRASAIRNTLAWTESPPWLVFANACEAGMDAEASAGHYQGDVFGLATAFINKGVAAYIAPLWPVDDAVAAQLAVGFYQALLLDRMSLGEALHRAKALARQEPAEPPRHARAALSWASVVLYGDPTPRLLQALWTPYAEGTAVPKSQRHTRPPVRR
jgi:CHAT domain-containing protein